MDIPQEKPHSGVEVRGRAQYFESLLRNQIALSFKQRVDLSMQDSIELSCVSKAASDGPNKTRSISPQLMRLSSRRGEEALNALILETSRLINSPCGEGDQLQAVEALSEKLADIATTLCKKASACFGLWRPGMQIRLSMHVTQHASTNSL